MNAFVYGLNVSMYAPSYLLKLTSALLDFVFTDNAQYCENAAISIFFELLNSNFYPHQQLKRAN